MGKYLCGTSGFEVHEDGIQSATRCSQPAEPRLAGICQDCYDERTLLHELEQNE